jgi:hypothetical protein
MMLRSHNDRRLGKCPNGLDRVCRLGSKERPAPTGEAGSPATPGEVSMTMDWKVAFCGFRGLRIPGGSRRHQRVLPK